MEAIANADLSAEVVRGLHEHDLAALGEDLHDLLHGEDGQRTAHLVQQTEQVAAASVLPHRLLHLLLRHLRHAQNTLDSVLAADRRHIRHISPLSRHHGVHEGQNASDKEVCKAGEPPPAANGTAEAHYVLF